MGRRRPPGHRRPADGHRHRRLASILIAERTALNFLCHLSGIATLTRRYADAASPGAHVRDTRKTTPGLRALEKAAVRAGGGLNHRGNLSDGILLKDNHLFGISIEEAVAKARDLYPGRPDPGGVRLAAPGPGGGPGRRRPGAARQHDAGPGVRLRVGAAGHRLPGVVEVSGGVTLENVPTYASAGAQLISVGALTHSAPALDIGLDLR